MGDGTKGKGTRRADGSERISLFVPAADLAALRAMHAGTGIPVATLIRQGIAWRLTQPAILAPTTARRGRR